MDGDIDLLVGGNAVIYWCLVSQATALSNFEPKWYSRVDRCVVVVTVLILVSQAVWMYS